MTGETQVEQTMAENRLLAVQHPLRASILRILDERASSPGEMARELREPDVSKVSYHTRRLEKLGCAELVYTRKGKRGSVEHIYRGTERHLLDTAQWRELVRQKPELTEHLVGEYMQAIIDDFVTGCGVGVGTDENFHITRTPTLLDMSGLEEAVELFERFRLEMLDLQDRALARGGRTFTVSSSLALFRTSPY
jgi:hypothetical protein